MHRSGRITKGKVNFWDKLTNDRPLREVLTDIQSGVVEFKGIGKKHQRPNYAFEIDSNFIRNVLDERFKYRGICQPGSLVLIDGKPKSRKSTLAAMLVAAHLHPTREYQNIKCNLNIYKHVYWFDTEMLKTEFEERFSNLLRWAGLDYCPERFHALNCASMGNNPELKIMFIINTIRNHREHYANRYGVIDEKDDIGMIVIDVFSDLVNDVNKKEESMDLLGFMIATAIETGAVIVLIMHQNKRDDSANGILGNDAAKKVSAHIKTFKKGSYASVRDDDDDDEGDNNEPTKVKMQESRGGEKFKLFYFNYDDNGDPVVIDHFSGI